MSWFGLILAVLPPTTPVVSSASQEFAAVVAVRPDAAQGEKLFETCAACHGRNGAGASDGTVPAIAAQHFRVLVRELVDFRHDERKDERMQHFANQHHLSGAHDIADVAAYISRLPATRSADHGSGGSLEHGAHAYARLCASCHGAAGGGDDRRGYPRLAGQHYSYLLEQLQDAAQDQRPNLSAEHVRLLQSLQQPNVAAIADYLSRLGP